MEHLDRNDPFYNDYFKLALKEVRADLDRGKTQKEIISELSSRPIYGFPVNLLEDVFAHHNKQVGLINGGDNIIALRKQERERGKWYTGGDNIENAEIWPPLKAKLQDKIGKGFDAINDSSDLVVGSLRPAKEESFRIRGLVVGYVQSGKTTNYMSVIAKAADVGYRLIIVLSGITNSLREQTESRLRDQLINNDSHWFTLTTLEQDFNEDPRRASQFLSPGRSGNQIKIAVVKKNSTVLRKLNAFIRSAGTSAQNCPILIIDDEADQASINTAPHAKEENSAINKHLKELLRNNKVAYVGYTATPYANVLVNPSDTEDIYPEDFIYVLPKPKGYFGAEDIFGRDPINGEEPFDTGDSEPLNVFRLITDEEAEVLKPPRGRRKKEGAVFDPHVTDSLREATQWFLMATAARRIRGQEQQHNSMLVHTTMSVDGHQRLYDILDQEVRDLRAYFNTSKGRESFRRLWEAETSAVPADRFGLAPISFEEVARVLPEVFEEVKVVVDNGMSEERLDYESGVQTVIAIGGNTLARGLTLEGLTTSYFVRDSTAYDTLLQMGRWFGFRQGYQDLPRIWMTDELRTWFYDLATIEADLRQELARYADGMITPTEVVPKIRTHSSLSITAAAKMQDAVDAKIGFSGRRIQTIHFEHRNEEVVANNLDAARSFAEHLGKAYSKNFIEKNNGTTVVREVSTDDVIKFLEDYKFYEESDYGKQNGKYLIDYIRAERASGSIRTWNVSFFGKQAGSNDQANEATIDLGPIKGLRLVTRSAMAQANLEVARIGALVGSRDRLNDADLSPDALKKINERINAEKERSESILIQSHADHVGNDVGHLGLYLIDKGSKPRGSNADESLISDSSRKVRRPLDAVDHLVGVGIFFPESNRSDSSVSYVSAIRPVDPEALEAQEELYEVISGEAGTDKDQS